MDPNACPKCGFPKVNAADQACRRCGVIFAKYQAATAPKQERVCHEVDYTISGDDMQIVEVELDPGETVVAEAGAMNYMEEGIRFETMMGDGSSPAEGIVNKLLAAGKRRLSGESIFMTHFSNKAREKKRIAFSAPYPGKIIPIDMATIKNEILCQKDAFLCAAYGTELDIAFVKKLGAGFFGGEGFILQRLRGDGMAFLHAGGTVTKKELHKETIIVDTGCIVGFTGGLSYDIQRERDLKSMFFGGEGLFLTTLSGTGVVLLQSLPFSRLADRILQQAPQKPSLNSSQLENLSARELGEVIIHRLFDSE
jgi:uncharacterized protein (TIGR00266 family)